jgi:hypothetical protein
VNLDTLQRIRAWSARRACLAANPAKPNGPGAVYFGELRHHHRGVATTPYHKRLLRLVSRVSLLDFSYCKYAAKLGNQQNRLRRHPRASVASGASSFLQSRTGQDGLAQKEVSGFVHLGEKRISGRETKS